MKKLLLSLFVSFISLISFGNCYWSDYSTNGFQDKGVLTLDDSLLKNNSTPNFAFDLTTYGYGVYCFSINTGFVVGVASSSTINLCYSTLGSNDCSTYYTHYNFPYKYYFTEVSTFGYSYDGGIRFPNTVSQSLVDIFYSNNVYCVVPYTGMNMATSVSNVKFQYFNTIYYKNLNALNVPLEFELYFKPINFSCPTCPTCDYTNYENQINVLSGDLLTCQNNYSSCSNSLGICGNQLNSCNNALGNCMQGNVGTGINWSSLFINGIQHVGKPLINITIPQEINWDYTNSGTVFDLSVVGFNQDSDYIESIINLQNTKPTEDDFNKIVSEIIPLFVPGLLIIAFIYFIFRFLRKIF